MPESDWDKIVQWYWNTATLGNQIQDQCVANEIMDWYWGSGNWAFSRVTNVLKNQFPFFGSALNDNGKNTVMNQDLITAINSVDQSKLSDALHNDRLLYYDQLAKYTPSDHVYVKGWDNRANDLYNQCKLI
jgi:hypothetical protein